MVELFAESDTTARFWNRTDTIIDIIKSITNEQILGTDMGELAEYYFENYKIQPINLLLDEMEQELCEAKIEKMHPYNQRIILIDGYKISFKIPYDGDNWLLYLRPSEHYMCKFTVDSVTPSTEQDYGQIVYSCNYAKGELDNRDDVKGIIQRGFEEQFRYYKGTVETINREVRSYNSSLMDRIKGWLEERKRNANNYIALREKLEIPLKINSDAPSIKPIVLKKVVANKPKPQMPKVRQPDPDYGISEADYKHICEIIKYSGSSMEKTAGTFAKLEEEELRDIIISHLNTHYEGGASGETFNKAGKTDIHILFENKAAYIGECKIWHGEKAFSDAIQQLFSYLTWRDVKTSVIVFNKTNKDFHRLLKTIDAFLRQESLCKEVNRREDTNEWTCKFRKDAECSDYVAVQVVVFDLCI